jgi:hypothetical protein
LGLKSGKMMKIDLTLEEVNGVLVGLGHLPYAQVQPLIDKIREQVIPQVQAESEATKAEPIEDVYV